MAVCLVTGGNYHYSGICDASAITHYRVKHQYSATIYIRTQLLVTYEEYLNT